MILVRSPFRISFVGGTTDLPAWSNQHAGAVVSTTIDKSCWITVRHRKPFFPHKYRIVYSKVEQVQTIDEIQHPAVRACLTLLKLDDGVEIHTDGDLPARSGMGASSSFVVGLLLGLHALRGEWVSKYRLADEAIVVEQDLLKETVGLQDPIAAAYGGLNRIDFTKDQRFSVNPIPLLADRVEEFRKHMVLVYTGGSRENTSSEITQAYHLEEQSRHLRVLHSMVDEAVSILSGGGDLAPFGHLLHDAWRLKRDLGKISTPEIDLLVDRVRAAGATGQKLLGAGGGGFLLVFGPPSKIAGSIREALKDWILVDFDLSSEGASVALFAR